MIYSDTTSPTYLETVNKFFTLEKCIKTDTGTFDSLDLLLTLTFPYLNLSHCLAMLTVSKQVQSLLFSREVIATLHKDLPSNALSNHLKQHKWHVQSPFINVLLQTAKILKISSFRKVNSQDIAFLLQSTPSLTSLHLHGIYVDRQIFDALPSTLQTLKLHATSLDPVAPHLPNLKELRIYLCTEKNNPSSIAPMEKLCSSSTIEQLQISGDQITSLALFIHLTGLQNLAISDCDNISSHELKELGKLVKLSSLDIHNCENVTSIQEIASLRLTHLCVHHLTMKPEQTVYLKKMTTLISLTFEHYRRRVKLHLNNFLSSLSLTQLTLQNSDISKEDVEDILRCTTLRNLSFQSSRPIRTIHLDLSNLYKLPNLTKLNLMDSEVGDNTAKVTHIIHTCSTLQELMIEKPSELPEELLRKFRDLRIVSKYA